MTETKRHTEIKRYREIEIEIERERSRETEREREKEEDRSKPHWANLQPHLSGYNNKNTCK